jgi:hypothetical protein
VTRSLPTAPLQLYAGQLLIGEIRDHGGRKVTAVRIDSEGRRTPVGTFCTRIAAMRAIAAGTPVAPAQGAQ